MDISPIQGKGWSTSSTCPHTCKAREVALPRQVASKGTKGILIAPYLPMQALCGGLLPSSDVSQTHRGRQFLFPPFRVNINPFLNVLSCGREPKQSPIAELKEDKPPQEAKGRPQAEAVGER